MVRYILLRATRWEFFAFGQRLRVNRFDFLSVASRGHHQGQLFAYTKGIGPVDRVFRSFFVPNSGFGGRNELSE